MRSDGLFHQVRVDPMDAHGGRVVCTRRRTAVGGGLGVNLGVIRGRVGPTRTHGVRQPTRRSRYIGRQGGRGTGEGVRSQPGEGVMRQARNPPCADPDTTPSKRPAGAKGLRLRPGPNIDRMSLIRYSVYGHRQPASPLVFWGMFVVGSWCAGHGGLGRVYDSVWTEAYRCTGELERL